MRGQGARRRRPGARRDAFARSVSALTRAFRDSQVGTTHRALTLEDGSLAVTGNYLKVRIPPGCARNEWVASVRSERVDLVTGFDMSAIQPSPVCWRG